MGVSFCKGYKARKMGATERRIKILSWIVGLLFCYYVYVYYTTFNIGISNFHKFIVPLEEERQNETELSIQYDKVVIGLGCAKCGSTYFIEQLTSHSQSKMKLNKTKAPIQDQSQSSNRSQAEIQRRSFLLLQRNTKRELHYWDYCFTHGPIEWWFKWFLKWGAQLLERHPHLNKMERARVQCSWKGYIQEWHRFDHLSEANRVIFPHERSDPNLMLVLSEKSPRYAISPHAPYLLSHYISKYFRTSNFVKLYFLFRDPTRKLWSHFWRRCLSHWTTNMPLNTTEINALCMKRISNIIQNMLESRWMHYPYVRDIWEELQSDVTAEEYSKARWDESNNRYLAWQNGVVTKYVNFFYVHSMDLLNAIDDITPFMDACYFIHLSMFQYMFVHTNSGNESANFQLFVQSVRVIRSEDVFDNSRLPILLQQFECWLWDDTSCVKIAPSDAPALSDRRHTLSSKSSFMLNAAKVEMPLFLQKKAQHTIIVHFSLFISFHFCFRRFISSSNYF
ncbi:hypothetical protein RFI_07379 [Reticulomyxa filosa]|uniref:Sulfotransferase domain-containing protein n=1 Tax=Reticulomyxa filosa TaxID=46433 RepID=X6NV25_RETFI|nr:hypothetical protein RFI_07379 [Reticulomyxa filosa]|eukprot:ETO29743.1 hypothetical protein RFI_07379 [Reticulomyxa filosa]